MTTTLSICPILSSKTVFSSPRRVTELEWLEYMPFGFWIIEALQPKLLVETGTVSGDSYFAFCQAADELKLDTLAFAICSEERQLDANAIKSDNGRLYSSFSRVIEPGPSAEQSNFSSGSVDLLHLTGHCSYETIDNCLSAWLPKLSDRGVILIDNVSIRDQDNGAWRIMEELSRKHPSFILSYGDGLGVIGMGENLPQSVQWLFNAPNRGDTIQIRDLFAKLGNTLKLQHQGNHEASGHYQAKEAGDALDKIHILEGEVRNRDAQIGRLSSEIANKSSEIAHLRSQAISLKMEIERTISSRVVAAPKVLNLPGKKESLPSRRLFHILKRLRFLHVTRALYRSGLFDVKHYLAQNPQVTNSPFDPATHYLLIGSASGMEPNQLFSDRYYEKRYPDVVRSGVNPLYHFLRHGKNERRDPHPIFDTDYYLRENPDILNADINPLLHFVRSGQFEERSPSILFDAEYYLSQFESRPPRGVFSPLMHYLTVGAALGYNPHPLFDTAYYLGRHVDVAQSGQNPLIHFLCWAGVEARNPHPLFDSRYYFEMYPDIRGLEMNPLVHYLRFGEAEGRNPSRFFDSEFYRRSHLPHLKTPEGVLRHFVTEGWKRGLAPSNSVNFANFLRGLPEGTNAQLAFHDFFGRIVHDYPLGYVSPHLRIVTERNITQAPRKLPDSEKNVLGLSYFAPLTVISGLGEAARGYAKAMNRESIICHTVPTTVPPYQEKVAISPSYSRPDWPIALAHVNADDIHNFFITKQGEDFLRSAYRMAFWVWELPSFPQDWMVNIAALDEVWTPSSFCKNAISALTSKPVHCIPHVVELSKQRLISGADVRRRFSIPSKAFMFLFIFDASSYVDRKNPFALVRAFLDEFGPEDNAVLVLKVGYSRINREFQETLRELTSSRRGSSIVIIDKILPRSDLDSLVEATDCYVSPHRSEGFGLTVAESMLRGKPVIATNYGATTDFLNEETGFPVDYKLIELKEDLGPYGAGNLWADPSAQHPQERMREVFEDRELSSQKGDLARRFIQKSFSREAVGKTIRDRIESIHQAMNI